MRKFLAVILSISSPLWAITPALVAHVQCAGAGSCTTAATNMTGATLLVLCQKTAGGADTTVSDSLGNTWTALTAVSGGTNPFVQIFYKANPTVGATQTFSTGTGGSVFGITALGFSGIAATTPFDQQNGAGGATITSKQPGSITPTVDGELLLSCLGGTMNDTGSTIDNSFSLSDTTAYDGSTTYGGGVAWKVQTTAAAINPTWTFSSSNATAVIASFKAGSPSSFGTINNPVPGGI